MKVVLAGATGFIGTPLVRSLAGDGHELVVLTRSAAAAQRDLPASARAVQWDGRTVSPSWAGELRGADAVMNLCGANIGARRWTAERKQVLVESRTQPAGALIEAMRALPDAERPDTLINASGIDYYGDRGDEVVTEQSRPGTSFLADLCIQWEAAAQPAEAFGTRVVLVRTAVVLGRGSDALRRMALPFRLFAGGPLGSGRQWFSWVHLDDTVGLYRFALEHREIAGPLNVVAPDVRREADVAREIGRTLGRPSWAPAPAFAIRLVVGEQAQLVLHGRHAEPRKALAAGYSFKYPTLPEALRAAL